MPPWTRAARLSENIGRMCFSKYGVRVPAVIVSPWIARGKVDHTLYDHSSILATLERKLGLPPLTRGDAAAADLWDLLDLAAARTDCPATLVEPVLPPADYGKESAAPVTADDSLPPGGNAIGFLRVLLKTEIELAEKSGARAVEDILADFAKIETHAHACDDVRKIGALLDTL